MRTVVLASLVVFLSPFISTVSTAKQKSSASIITTKDGSTYLVSTTGQNHSSKSEDYKDGQRRRAQFHLRNHCRGQSQSSCQSTGLLSLTIVLIGIYIRDGRPVPRGTLPPGKGGFPAPPRAVGRGGFPAPPRPVKMIKTAGKLRGKINTRISTFSKRGNK